MTKLSRFSTLGLLAVLLASPTLAMAEKAYLEIEAYLASELSTKDVVVGLKPLLKADPEVRIYTAN